MFVTRVYAAEYCHKTGAPPFLSDDIFKFALVEDKHGFKIDKFTGELTTDNVMSFDTMNFECLFDLMDILYVPANRYFTEERNVPSLSEKVSDKELEVERMKKKDALTNAILVCSVAFVICFALLLLFILSTGGR